MDFKLTKILSGGDLCLFNNYQDILSLLPIRETDIVPWKQENINLEQTTDLSELACSKNLWSAHLP